MPSDYLEADAMYGQHAAAVEVYGEAGLLKTLGFATTPAGLRAALLELKEARRELADGTKHHDAYRRLLVQREEQLALAWGLISNASGGDWLKESAMWAAAAASWRDDYFKKGGR